MVMNKIKLSERDSEAILSSGFGFLLKHGYEKTDMKQLAEELSIPWEDVQAAYNSKEDYYLEALRHMLIKSCEDFRYKRTHATSYTNACAVYRRNLMQTQTKPFISSIYTFYTQAETELIRRFWKIIEDYARVILKLFNKVPTRRNIKTFIYCLSMIFSKSALVMHDAPSDTVCGCGNDESDILFREIKAMRDKSKTNNEDREFVSHT